MKDIVSKTLIVFSLTILTTTLAVAKEGWDFLVFAQQWPPALCATHKKEKCVIPEGVNGWTVHGLWPTDDKGYPTFCNKSWPFQLHNLQPILVPLRVKWPNLFSKTPEDSFWKHEWQKHGTCAAYDEKLNGELKYFTTSIQFRDDYNIYELLRRAGFLPSKSKPIVLKYVENALNLQLKKKIQITCTASKGYQYPLLTSVSICIDKNFELMDCEDKLVHACNNSFLTYLPYAHQEEEEEETGCGCI